MNDDPKTVEETVKALRAFTYWCGSDNPASRDIHPPLCDDAAGLIDSLQDQLSKTQRREQAAVNDLQKSIKFYALGTCICGLCLKHSCNEFCYGKSWEWRGPQEAGKVDNDDQTSEKNR